MKHSPFALFIFEHYVSVSRFSERLNISRQTASWYIHLRPARLNVKHLQQISDDTGEDIAYIVALITESQTNLTCKKYEQSLVKND